MRPYLWALGSIWGTWLTADLTAYVYGAFSSTPNAEILAFLVWILGIMLAAILSVVACAAIACEQCMTAVTARRAP